MCLRWLYAYLFFIYHLKIQICSEVWFYRISLVHWACTTSKFLGVPDSIFCRGLTKGWNIGGGNIGVPHYRPNIWGLKNVLVALFQKFSPFCQNLLRLQEISECLSIICFNCLSDWKDFPNDILCSMECFLRFVRLRGFFQRPLNGTVCQKETKSDETDEIFISCVADSNGKGI